MQFRSCGDAAFTIELGSSPHLMLTRSIAALHAALQRTAPHGYLESVPGLTSLTILFDPDLTSRSQLEDEVQRCASSAGSLFARAREWHFPVCYSGDYAPDLAEVALASGLTENEVVAAHTARSYVVYLLGFSPGFPYLGDIDARIALPRRSVPRPRVPAGSVAIATQYTAVYPQDTAGGWHIIGRTPVRFFDTAASPPALVAPGDTVRFYAVSSDEYERFPRHRMTTLRIIKAGICSTLQDTGRVGYRAYGVPRSGALDAVALELVNRLVGNDAGEAAIEMLYSGVALRVEAGSMRVALAGADATIERAENSGKQTLPAFHSVTLFSGDTLRVGAIAAGATAYLALEGGLDVPHVLGSASTYLRGAIGGYHGRALRTGDVIATRLERAPERAERCYTTLPQLAAPTELRVIAGPQAGRFDDASLHRFTAAPYTVSTSSDRSGLRLEGEALTHVGGFDLTSEGVAPGSIQVPGSGLPVILVADHPTVGGYPKIATIITADLPAAGRLRIGSAVSFRCVDEDEAREARAHSRRGIEEILANLSDVAQ